MSIISTGKGNSKYNIYITKNGILKSVLNSHLSRKNKILIVTDNGVPSKYINSLKKDIKNKDIFTIVLKKGEKSKSFDSYQKILNKLIKLKFDRSDYLIALGGGVVGDITGFVASSYLRGIDYIQIPTTLLAQVDSSVGGKTAINLKHGKNLVGAFYNPKLVLISTHFLQSLSNDEYKSGLGEVLKYAFIGNKTLKNIIENNTNKIIARNESILKAIIEESVKTKSKIVTKDERESGIRAILNFGHTFGHAIEAYNDYKNITHGAAITLGMVIASKVSFFEGHLKDYQLNNIINMINSLDLCSDHSQYNYSKLKKYMASDKKVKDGKLNLILINRHFKAFKTSKYNLKNVIKSFN